MSKKLRRFFRISTLIWFVVFVFVVLVVSQLASGLAVQLLVNAGVLPNFHINYIEGLEDFIPETSVFLFIIAVNALVGTVLAALGGDYFLRPLRRLTNAAKEISEGNFKVRVPVKGSIELERLSESFNEMAKGLSDTETLRSDFVSNISHEFKTPVASIRGFAKRLLKDDLTDEQRKDYLEIIINESERLTRLSSNVLLLSNLESESLSNKRKTYHLDEQLRKVLLLLEPQLQKKKLQTNILLEPLKITANEENLHHVWLNLLENAIKFSYPEGTIEIKLEAREDTVSISVYDQGLGISSEVKGQIFEKFYQADTSRATDGNGLGLSLVKKIVELESGHIQVESEQNKGSRFTVTFNKHKNP